MIALKRKNSSLDNENEYLCHVSGKAVSQSHREPVFCQSIKSNGVHTVTLFAQKRSKTSFVLTLQEESSSQLTKATRATLKFR